MCCLFSRQKSLISTLKHLFDSDGLWKDYKSIDGKGAADKHRTGSDLVNAKNSAVEAKRYAYTFCTFVAVF